jgi:hypothetical protein
MHVSNIDRVRKHCQTSSRCAFWNNILDFSGTFLDSKCFDRRDKIYALLSLVSEQPSITPNYTISVPELFLRLCPGAMRGTQRMPHFVRVLQSLQMSHAGLVSVLLEVVDDHLFTNWAPITRKVAATALMN